MLGLQRNLCFTFTALKADDGSVDFHQSISRSGGKVSLRPAAPICYCSLAILASLFLCCGALSLQIEGKVDKVVDGRSFVLREANGRVHGILLMGVDTPELGQPKHWESVQLLTRDLLKQTVLVDWYRLESRCSKRPAKDCSKMAKVLRLPDNMDPALHLIQRGLAWFVPDSKADQSTTDRRLYQEAEQLAQFKRLGIWNELKPEPPWEYRKRKGREPSTVLPSEPKKGGAAPASRSKKKSSSAHAKKKAH